VQFDERAKQAIPGREKRAARLDACAIRLGAGSSLRNEACFG
jgi:hypothetical protein